MGLLFWLASRWLIPAAEAFICQEPNFSDPP
jgi:hypothetical protein